jgi:hypothetical protein
MKISVEIVGDGYAEPITSREITEGTFDEIREELLSVQESLAIPTETGCIIFKEDVLRKCIITLTK